MQFHRPGDDGFCSNGRTLGFSPLTAPRWLWRCTDPPGATLDLLPSCPWSLLIYFCSSWFECGFPRRPNKNWNHLSPLAFLFCIYLHWTVEIDKYLLNTSCARNCARLSCCHGQTDNDLASGGGDRQKTIQVMIKWQTWLVLHGHLVLWPLWEAQAGPVPPEKSSLRRRCLELLAIPRKEVTFWYYF